MGLDPRVLDKSCACFFGFGQIVILGGHGLDAKWRQKRRYFLKFALIMGGHKQSV